MKDPNSTTPSTKLPRCPVCKHKSKRFVPLYLTFGKEEDLKNQNANATASASSCAGIDISAMMMRSRSRTRSLSSHTDETENDSEIDRDTDDMEMNIEPMTMIPEPSSTDEDANQAVRLLSTENFKLRKHVHELKSLSKDQSDLLLDVMPKFDSLESKLRQILREKEQIEKQLTDVEAENSDLISDWNEVEMKMHLLQMEKNELMKDNNELLLKSMEVDQKLVKARKKRKRVEEVMKSGFEDQKIQAKELEVVKNKIIKSREEKNRFVELLKESQLENEKLRKKVKNLKRMSRNGGSCTHINGGSREVKSSNSKAIKKLYKERKSRIAKRARTERTFLERLR